MKSKKYMSSIVLILGIVSLIFGCRAIDLPIAIETEAIETDAFETETIDTQISIETTIIDNQISVESE